MTEASPLPRSSGWDVSLLVVIAGCDAQPIKTSAMETRTANFSAVDFMRVCLATVVPGRFSLVTRLFYVRIGCENGTNSFRSRNARR